MLYKGIFFVTSRGSASPLPKNSLFVVHVVPTDISIYRRPDESSQVIINLGMLMDWGETVLDSRLEILDGVKISWFDLGSEITGEGSRLMWSVSCASHLILVWEYTQNKSAEKAGNNYWKKCASLHSYKFVIVVTIEGVVKWCDKRELVKDLV